MLIRSSFQGTVPVAYAKLSSPHQTFVLAILKLSLVHFRLVKVQLQLRLARATGAQRSYSCLTLRRFGDVIAENIIRIEDFCRQTYLEVPTQIEAELVKLRRLLASIEEELTAVRQRLEDEVRDTGLANARLQIMESRSAIARPYRCAVCSWKPR